MEILQKFCASKSINLLLGTQLKIYYSNAHINSRWLKHFFLLLLFIGFVCRKHHLLSLCPFKSSNYTAKKWTIKIQKHTIFHHHPPPCYVQFCPFKFIHRAAFIYYKHERTHTHTQNMDNINVEYEDWALPFPRRTQKTATKWNKKLSFQLCEREWK